MNRFLRVVRIAYIRLARCALAAHEDHEQGQDSSCAAVPSLYLLQRGGVTGDHSLQVAAHAKEIALKMKMLP